MGVHDGFFGGAGGGFGFGAQQGGLGTVLKDLFGGFGGAGGEAAHNNPATSQLNQFGAGLGGGLVKLLDNMKVAYSGDNTAFAFNGQQNQQDGEERFIRQLEQLFNSMNDGSGGASAPKTPGHTISVGKNPTTPMRVTVPQYSGPQLTGPQFPGQPSGNRIF